MLAHSQFTMQQKKVSKKSCAFQARCSIAQYNFVNRIQISCINALALLFIRASFRWDNVIESRNLRVPFNATEIKEITECVLGANNSTYFYSSLHLFKFVKTSHRFRVNQVRFRSNLIRSFRFQVTSGQVIIFYIHVQVKSGSGNLTSR